MGVKLGQVAAAAVRINAGCAIDDVGIGALVDGDFAVARTFQTEGLANTIGHIANEVGDFEDGILAKMADEAAIAAIERGAEFLVWLEEIVVDGGGGE